MGSELQEAVEAARRQFEELTRAEATRMFAGRKQQLKTLRVDLDTSLRGLASAREEYRRLYRARPELEARCQGLLEELAACREWRNRLREDMRAASKGR